MDASPIVGSSLSFFDKLGTGIEAEKSATGKEREKFH